MADEGKSHSTPKQRLLDAKNQAAMYMKEERAAEVAHFAHSMSESLIKSTLSSVICALPVATTSTAAIFSTADAKESSTSTHSSSQTKQQSKEDSKMNSDSKY